MQNPLSHGGDHDEIHYAKLHLSRSIVRKTVLVWGMVFVYPDFWILSMVPWSPPGALLEKRTLSFWMLTTKLWSGYDKPSIAGPRRQ